MKRNRWIAALLAMSLAVSASAGSITALGANSAPQGSTVLVNPKVNSRVNPIGIDDTDPVFSWQLDSNIIGPVSYTHLRNNQPELFAQIHRCLQPKDYIIYRLTGNYVRCV